MKRFVNFFRNEQGLTLIEMIAAITLSAMVVGLISGITMFGIRSYHKITIENTLRDEADIIMSAIITELYTSAPDKVGNMSDGSGVETFSNLKGNTPMQKIFIKDGQLIIGNSSTVVSKESITATTSDLSGSEIKFTSSSELCRNNIPCDTGLVEIDLVLVQNFEGREYKLELESKFGF
ncbi:hypothetical protein R70723_30205 [Paenibacillus sp. FSL R7-0273]|uniref:PilW family protein n=1 Tax=Paenibacillus sp. FSL R7-0273 TaxID=1536772 RepID=UPI0004F68B97|nr:prepilin-type N-terminal cleavage/methylation domain-containing protein [Paenibacillus sp. FSL R7-0273]AIQ49677.1 hypothetical protein R70723_30205 [Paenibacillus sp. FSL R7-0273]OMF90262.1 hypothetical protein BK144_17855 [Paenibacillus sp. FSL R7-0273]